MGSDIHSYAELRGPDGIWRAVGEVFPYPYFHEDKPESDWQCWDERGENEVEQHTDLWEHGPNCWRDNHSKTVQPIVRRNYDLFAILANVRNGRGFAGVPTGSGFEPVAPNRGIPDDVDPRIKRYYDGWGSDAHSATWLTLAELKKYDWHGQESTHIGVVPARLRDDLMADMDSPDRTDEERARLQEVIDRIETYEKMQAEGRTAPRQWSSWVDGRNILVMGDEEYNKRKEIGDLPPGKSIYVAIAWKTTYYESVSDFVDETIPLLEQIGDPDNVRVVCWFDC
jgi:hypothetical protein